MMHKNFKADRRTPGRVGLAALLLALLVGMAGCGKDTGADYPSEGSLLAPLVLPPATAAGTPVTWSGTVGAVHSYYQVEVSNTLKYVVGLRGLSSDADLLVNLAPTFTPITVVCASMNLDANAETCDWTVPGAILIAPLNILYILVKAVDPKGAQFTLEVSPQ